MRHATATIVLTLAAVCLLGGCSRSVAPPATSSVPLASVAPAPLKLMTAAEKSTKIAHTFPVEVPVPSGDVVSGEAQGATAWDYQLVVAGDMVSRCLHADRVDCDLTHGVRDDTAEEQRSDAPAVRGRGHESSPHQGQRSSWSRDGRSRHGVAGGRSEPPRRRSDELTAACCPAETR